MQPSSDEEAEHFPQLAVQAPQRSPKPDTLEPLTRGLSALGLSPGLA